MVSEKWNTGDAFPLAGGRKTNNVNFMGKKARDNYAYGTSLDPRIVWTCFVPGKDLVYKNQIELATERRVTEWARKTGFSMIWIRGRPHATQTVSMPNGQPEFARDSAGVKLKEEKRYEMADPHITIRAGMVHHQRYGSDLFTCLVSGHLYVRLDANGLPNFDRPMLETDRKLVELGDYRVDQMWEWQGEDQPLKSSSEKPRLGYKRVLDDGDYYSQHDIQLPASKLFRWDVNEDAVKYTHNPPFGWDVNEAGSIAVETAPSGLYLPRPLLERLRWEEARRQERLREEEQDRLKKEMDEELKRLRRKSEEIEERLRREKAEIRRREKIRKR